jgi:hypothetical protein
MATFDSPIESPHIPESTGDRIQHARRVLGVFLGWDITQSHLAAFLDIPLDTVVGLEGDSVDVQPLLEHLCLALGVRPEYLLFGTGPIANDIDAGSRAHWRLVLNGGSGTPVVRARTEASPSV